MARNRKLPSRAAGELRSERGRNQLTQVLEHLPQMVVHLGADRLMLILVAAIFAGGLTLRVTALDLLIIEVPIFIAWGVGKCFKWF